MSEPRGRLAAAARAKEIVAGEYVVFDLETTGFSGYRDRVVSIAIINQDGEVLLDSLVHPGIEIPNSHIHGITDAMVIGAPTFIQLHPVIVEALQHKTVLSYNYQFDGSFINGSCDQHDLDRPAGVHGECIMTLFAKFYGDWNNYRKNYRWQKLTKAADFFVLQFDGQAHHALADARMAWGVLKKMAEWEAPVR